MTHSYYSPRRILYWYKQNTVNTHFINTCRNKHRDFVEQKFIVQFYQQNLFCLGSGSECEGIGNSDMPHYCKLVAQSLVIPKPSPQLNLVITFLLTRLLPVMVLLYLVSGALRLACRLQNISSAPTPA
jgi:hypothetical protein